MNIDAYRCAACATLRFSAAPFWLLFRVLTNKFFAYFLNFSITEPQVAPTHTVEGRLTE